MEEEHWYIMKENNILLEHDHDKKDQLNDLIEEERHMKEQVYQLMDKIKIVKEECGRLTKPNKKTQKVEDQLNT